MKVICINENWKPENNPTIVSKGFPLFGNTYNVIDKDYNKFLKKLGYALQELDNRIFWLADHFAQVETNLDELEIHINELETCQQ